MTLCEAACYYKQKNMTLWDAMQEMYKKYGYYREKQFSITLKGAEGAQKIKEMMENMRKASPQKIAGQKVLSIGDYEKQKIYSKETGKETPTNLPKSNVLYYELENDTWCCVRPSGTEPKIKFYMGVKGSSLEDAQEKLEELESGMKEFAE